MKKYILLLALSLICAKYVHGQFSLNVEITKLRNNTGLILFQLFNEKEEIVVHAIGKIENQKTIIIIKDLKPGKYAFRYFHDENMSKKLETNVLGIPKEGYGFSNNGAGPFGPKPFKEWLFIIKENIKVTDRIRY